MTDFTNAVPDEQQRVDLDEGECKNCGESGEDHILVTVDWFDGKGPRPFLVCRDWAPDDWDSSECYSPFTDEDRDEALRDEAADRAYEQRRAGE